MAGYVPVAVVLAAQLTLYGMALVRGMDYASGDAPSTSHRLSAVEAALPLDVWGVGFILAATLGFAALAFEVQRGVMLAHTTLWVAYWAFGVGVVSDVFGRRFPHPSPENDFDRELPIAAFVAIVVLVIMWGRAVVTRDRFLMSVAGVFTACFAIAMCSTELDGLRNATILFGIGALHLALSIGTIARVRQQQFRDAKGD